MPFSGNLRELKIEHARICRRFLQILLVVSFVPIFAFELGNVSQESPVVGTERNRNLRSLDYVPMFMKYHELTAGNGRQFFTYPQRNAGFQEYIRNERSSLVHFADTLLGIDSVTLLPSHEFAIAISPVIAIDYRGGESLNDTIWPAIEGGLFIRGFADSLDFDLDARMYVESHSAGAKADDKRKPQSYDHEVFDVQSEDRGGADYVSYSRYRAHLGFNYAYARLELARDVMHWGPGYYNNLSLNQFTAPYNMLTLDLKFGPLHVLSAYADLRVNSWSYSRANLNDRNLYAHRYELNLFDNDLTIGMSELQILYNENKPWLFTPVIPLFIEKGNYTEHVNNGAIALDLNYRLFSFMRIYGEFFLDDMESPMAVYENKYSNNRWAAMLGFQAAHDFFVKGRKIEAGTIAEIARVEPYTYTHYDTAQAQMAHLGLPLGNPNGPNSLSIDWSVYAHICGLPDIFVSYRSQWLWKGSDYGSNIDDPYKTVEKRFIHGAKMHYSGTPAISYRGRRVAFTGEYTFGSAPQVLLRAMLMW